VERGLWEGGFSLSGEKFPHKGEIFPCLSHWEGFRKWTRTVTRIATNQVGAPPPVKKWGTSAS